MSVETRPSRQRSALAAGALAMVLAAAALLTAVFSIAAIVSSGRFVAPASFALASAAIVTALRTPRPRRVGIYVGMTTSVLIVGAFLAALVSAFL